MTGYSIGIVEAVLRAYDFSSFACVVDVGGGEGTQLAAILARHPAIRGILFDQPEIVTRAQPVLAAAGVDERCELVGGTFFEDVPGGGDAYLLKFILHDWDDGGLLTICRNADEHVRRTQNFWSWSRSLDRPTKGWRPNSPTFRCWWGWAARSGLKRNSPLCLQRPVSVWRKL